MPTGLEQARTLPVAAIGTALALPTCTKPVATLASTATSLGSGPEGQAWILSSMSPGLAVGLLLAGAVGDGYGRNRSATSVLTALPARRLPGCVSSRAHLVKPAVRRHPGRDSAEHSWHLALAAYLFAGAGQALETWRVLALLLRHDLPTQTQRSAHDHSARLAIRPAGTPAAIAMPGQLPNLCGASAPAGSCPPAPQPRLNRSPVDPAPGACV